MRHSKRPSCSRAEVILAPRPDIHPDIEVRPGIDLVDAWDRFEVFEALHHSIQICNPLSTEQLDEAIDGLDLQASSTVLDVACGYGEFLLRAAQREPIHGVGIDLSPWMITAAHRSSTGDLCTTFPVGSKLRWVIGEARDFRLPDPPGVAVCVGAEWVWHDFGGTARALAGRLGNGGLAVIGAARLHTGADQAAVRRERGFVESIDDQAQVLARHGLTPEHRIDPDDAGWDSYLAGTAAAAKDWAARYPGERSSSWIDEQADWQRAREHDRGVMGWSLWIARKTTANE